MRVSFDSALHSRCDRAPVGQKDVKRSTTHGMNGEYVLNLYTLAGELCVYVSREWGTGSHLLVVPRIDVSTLGIALGSGKQSVQKRSI